MIVSPELFVQFFARNTLIVMRQSEGLTHAQSLLQPPFRGNSLNWVVGHITAYRCRILELVGRERLWDAATAARYEFGSEPVLDDGPGVLPYDEILRVWQAAGEGITGALAGWALADMERIQPGKDRSYGAALFRYYSHELYHCGQTEYLRQLAGVNDEVVIPAN